MKYARLGRPRRFKSWPAIAALVIFGQLFLIGTWGVQWVHAEWTINAADASMSNYKSERILTITEENDILKDKLQRSSHVIVSDQTKALVALYIHKYFPQSEWSNAEKVARCESGWSPQAYNPNNTDKSQDRGVFQINTVHKKRFEAMYSVPYEVGAHDISLNIQYARFLWDHSKWNAWVCKKVLS